MRDYGRVYSSFWTSDDTRKLSDDAKMLALYLLSGPHGTIAGVCRLPDGYVHEDLGWSIKRVREGFGELFRKGFANRCTNTEWVWICRFLAWNTPENPNQWKAARKIASSVPSKCIWKADFSRVFENAEKGIIEPLPNPSGTLSEGLPTQEQDQNQEQKQKQEQEQEAQSLKFHDSLPRAEWDEWIAHRRRKKWPVDSTTLGKQLKLLSKLTAEQQIDSIEKSINAGWQGLFEPKNNGGEPRKTRFAQVTEGLDRA